MLIFLKMDARFARRATKRWRSIESSAEYIYRRLRGRSDLGRGNDSMPVGDIFAVWRQEDIGGKLWRDVRVCGISGQKCKRRHMHGMELRRLAFHGQS